MNGGDVFREEARSRGLTVEELSSEAKEDPDVDRHLDDLLQKRMSSPESPEIVESRLSGWWAHKNDIDCLRVWVSVSEKERARRIQKREGGEFADCLHRSQQRQEDDMDRYSSLYGIDLDDMSPYHLVIDADSKDEFQVFYEVDAILER